MKGNAEKRIKTEPRKHRPPHDTEYDNSTDKEHWRKMTIGYIKDQLFKRGVYPPKPSKMKKEDWKNIMHQWIDNQTASSSSSR